MVKTVSPDAKPGDFVTVYDKEGQLFGHGLYHPKAGGAIAGVSSW